MKGYSVAFDKKAEKQLKQLAKSGRKADLARALRFVEEIRADPQTGTGKPKPLSGENGEVWSRKTNDRDRFVYRIFEAEKRVLVTQVLGHYRDR